MKRGFQIARKVLEKACAEGMGGVDERHLCVMSALSNDDLADIQNVGELASARVAAMPEDVNTVLETVALLRKLLQGPSDEALEQHGISLSKVNDGMSVAEYQECDDDKEER